MYDIMYIVSLVVKRESESAESENDRFQMAVRGHLKYVSILWLGLLHFFSVKLD